MNEQTAADAFAALLRNDYATVVQLLAGFSRDDLWHLVRAGQQFSAAAENIFRSRPEQ